MRVTTRHKVTAQGTEFEIECECEVTPGLPATNWHDGDPDEVDIVSVEVRGVPSNFPEIVIELLGRDEIESQAIQNLKEWA